VLKKHILCQIGTLLFFASIANGVHDPLRDIWQQKYANRLPEDSKTTIQVENGTYTLVLTLHDIYLAAGEAKNIDDAFNALMKDYKSKFILPTNEDDN
jgi:hypothetical protein